MSPLGFILLLGLTTPQNQLAAVQQSGAEKGVAQAQAQAPAEAQRHLQQQMQRAMEAATRGGGFANAGCYAIRSYIFERQDGAAPVLVRTTTCTPANTVWPQRVSNPPIVRLVPQ